ncbi:hypothetical protein [Nostoc sp. FACHB-110]|nr:hypothetical protein [Nostoc sp. FACHB-110]
MKGQLVGLLSTFNSALSNATEGVGRAAQRSGSSALSTFTSERHI